MERAALEGCGPTAGGVVMFKNAMKSLSKEDVARSCEVSQGEKEQSSLLGHKGAEQQQDRQSRTQLRTASPLFAGVKAAMVPGLD